MPKRIGKAVRVWVAEMNGVSGLKDKMSVTIAVGVQRKTAKPSGRDHGDKSVLFPLEMLDYTINEGVAMDRVVLAASVTKPTMMGRKVLGAFRGSVADFPEGPPQEHELPICVGRKEVGTLRVRVQICSPDTPVPDLFDSAVAAPDSSPATYTPAPAAPPGAAMAAAAAGGMVSTSPAAAAAPAPAPASSGLYPGMPAGSPAGYPGSASPASGYPPAHGAHGAHGYPPAGGAHGYPPAGGAHGYPPAGGAHGYPSPGAPSPGYPSPGGHGYPSPGAPSPGYPPASAAPSPGYPPQYPGAAPPPYPA